ncbi:MAG: O-antigen ligase family protein [Paracoccaceae bacterium]
MIARRVPQVAATAGLAMLAFVVVVASSVSLKAAALLIPAMAVGAAVLLAPMAGMALLVGFAQMDALASLASQALPLSFYKLLTLATLAGFGLASFSVPRRMRLGARTAEARFVVLYVLAMALSFLMSEFKGASLEYLVGIYSAILLFFLILFLIDRPERLELLVWALVGSGLVAASFVLAETFLGIRLVATSEAAVTAQFEGQNRSAGASNFNPTTAAHMLAATTVLAGVLFVRSPRLRWLSGLTLLLGLPAVVLTFARSAAIAMALTVLVFAILNRRHRAFPFVLMTLVLAIAAAIPFVPPLFWERMATLTDFGLDRTLLRRVSYNVIGLHLWIEHPILGIGPGNYPFHYTMPEFRWMPGRELPPRQLHNTYMEVATETGIIGVSLFLAAVLSSLRRAVIAARCAVAGISPMAEALAYGFATFLAASVFMPNEDTKFMWIFAGLCVVAGQIADRQARAAREADEQGYLP